MQLARAASMVPSVTVHGSLVLHSQLTVDFLKFFSIEALNVVVLEKACSLVWTAAQLEVMVWKELGVEVSPRLPPNLVIISSPHYGLSKAIAVIEDTPLSCRFVDAVRLRSKCRRVVKSSRSPRIRQYHCSA